MLNEWLIARKRLAVVSMPDLAPMEQVNAMVGIVSEVLKTDSILQHRFASLRYSTSARSPSQVDATRIEQFLVAELNFIESNEMVEEGMKDSAWHLQEVPGRINAVMQDGPVSPKTSPKGDPKKVCTKFIRGKCTYGSSCFYSHDKQEKEKKNKEFEKIRKTTPCSFFSTARGCLKGSSCEYLHDKTKGVKQEEQSRGK